MSLFMIIGVIFLKLFFHQQYLIFNLDIKMNIDEVINHISLSLKRQKIIQSNISY